MHPDSIPAQTLLAAARQESPAAELRCRALLSRSVSVHETRAALQGELARCGLTESGFAVMAVLYAHEPGPVLRSDLGLAAGLSPMRTTDALTRLEMSRLVRRQRDSQDRRLLWLRLTPEGVERTALALRRYVAGAGLATESLDEQELTACLTTSDKLRAGAALLAADAAAAALT